MSGTAAVTVAQEATTVSVSPTADILAAGDTLRLSASALDGNGHEVARADISWSSSDPGIAAVDTSGLVTGVGPGTAVITATSGDAAGVMELRVVSRDVPALVEFYNATNGSNWSRNSNWLTDAPVAEWHGVGVDADGHVELLFLSRNGLEGSIPREIGDLVSLKRLQLDHNELSGPIPPELGGLAELTELRLSHNPGLFGPVPPALAGLRHLETFGIAGTDLCILPEDFQTWRERLPRQWLRQCLDGRASSAVYLAQAVQSRASPVPLVAGRRALLRAFVTAASETDHGMPLVRATFYLDGAETHTAEIPARSTPIPTAVREGDLAQSANAEIPGAVLEPGLELVVEIDPDGTLDAGLGVERRIPETGRLALDVREIPVLELTLVPFLWSESPDSAVVATVGEIAADPGNHDLLHHVRTLLPVQGMALNAHAPVTTSTNDPRELLHETRAIWTMEGESGHYMGMLTGPRSGSRVAGKAFWPGRVSFSILRSTTMAHELGHNMNLGHAPCGVTADLDPDYPYADGSIGAWGYDFRNGRLIAPSRPDVMSYCHGDLRWIGDYGVSKALHHRLSDEMAATAAAADGGTVASLLLWGGMSAEGAPFLEPAFVVDAPPSLPGPGGGAFRLDGWAADGGALFSHRFDMPKVADGDGSSSFAFSLPVETGWAAELASITLSGPAGTATLDADTDRPMVILREPGSGQVRALLRDPPPSALAGGAVDVGALTSESGLEALFSRGLPAPPAWRRWRH